MPHFLIKKEEIKDGFIEPLDNENLFHLTRVLRVKPNEKIKFIDEDKIVYSCIITEVSKNFLKARIIDKIKSQRVLEYQICLVQSVLMSDAQNLLIANAVQTGVSEIYPVLSDNTSPSRSSLKGKTEKWIKIAQENFKQCERADMPLVHEVRQLNDALSDFERENVLIFAEKFENNTLSNCLCGIDKTKKIAIVIGPEGGFSDAEFKCFLNEGYKLITLGKMIYKAPNAVVAAVSNIVSRIE